jgi:recombination protein RecT
MSAKNEMKPAEVQGRQLANLRDVLERASAKLAEVAPKHLKADRLVRLLLSAASRNPKILACSPQSVLQFAMKCSETGLEPIGAGGAWPIPYENRRNNTVELTFIPDYRGLIHCAKRSCCIKDAWAEVVYEGDEFSYRLGLDPALEHTPARRDRGNLEAAYCVFVMPDGTKRFAVMHADDIARIRSRSRAPNNGPWVTDTAEMWKKTIVRRAMRPFQGYAPSLDEAISADNEAETAIDLAPEDVPMPKAIDESQANEPADGEIIDPPPAPAPKEPAKKPPGKTNHDSTDPDGPSEKSQHDKIENLCAIKGQAIRTAIAPKKSLASLSYAEAAAVIDKLESMEDARQPGDE